MRHGAILAAFVVTILPARAGPQPVILAAPPGELHGSLLAAGKNAPAILIIAGSGPTDRDGNGPLVHTDTYKMVAEGLLAKGISTLRYDKRGIGESRSAMTAEADLRIQTYADDASAMAAALRKKTDIKCAWILGHSEGALLAEVMAQKPQAICGLILISATGRKLGAVIHDQLEANPANPAELKKAADDIITTLESGVKTDSVPALLMPLFRPSVQPYMISEIALDPAAMLARLKLPILIVQGDTDFQVSVVDARLLAAAKPDAKLVLLSGVNHVLKLAPADRAANVATYRDPSLPLAPGIVETIAAFVLEHNQ